MKFLETPYPRLGMWLGSIMARSGIVFVAWTHVCLGKKWSANLHLTDDHRLIQSGPYSRIRHPMYTALFATYVGLGLISNNCAALILIMMVVISLLLRVPKEENMMIERFGDEYRVYIEKTGRFFLKLQAD